MQKVLIIQHIIPEYRLPFYNKLGTVCDLTILHSSTSSINEASTYKEKIVGLKKISKFYFQEDVFSYIKTNNFDCVVPMFDLAWVKSMILPFMKSQKTILWGHRYSGNNIACSIRNFIMKRADANVLYSNCEVDRMISSGVDPSKIFVANNTIEVANHAFNDDIPKKSFLYVGRAQKRKNIDQLLNSFANIVSEIPADIVIEIIGEGAENEILKSLAESLGIKERVFFRGAIHDAEILKSYFHKSLAYVSPGSVGLGVLHSLAYGTPVVTRLGEYHGPEFNNVIDKENGIVYNEPEDLDQILISLANQPDKALLLGENGYQHYIENRSIDNMVNGFVEAINSVKE